MSEVYRAMTRDGMETSRSLTMEDLERLYDEIRNSPAAQPHGTAENPHIVHPVSRICLDCGGVFDER